MTEKPAGGNKAIPVLMEKGYKGPPSKGTPLSEGYTPVSGSLGTPPKGGTVVSRPAAASKPND